MDRGTRVFWGVLAILLAASVFFAVQGESARRRVSADAQADGGAR